MFGVYTLLTQFIVLPAIVLMTFHVTRTLQSKETERNIYEHIILHPGCIIPDISREHKLSNGMVRYYTRLLETDGKIMMIKIGKFSRLFTRSSAFSRIDKLLYSFTNNETNKILLLSIVNNVGITNHEISKKFHIDKSNIHRRLKILLKNRIITSKNEGRTKRYYINEIYYHMIIKIIKL